MFLATRISGYPLLKFSDFFRILGLCGLNFEAIRLKLDVNDNHMGPDVLGYSDIRLSGFFHLDFSDIWS